jgi:phage-related holin
MLSIGVFLFINYLAGMVESWFALKIGSRSMYGQGLWTSIGWLPMIIVSYFLFAVASMAGASWLGLILAPAIWLAALILIPKLVRKSLAKEPDIPAASPAQMATAA